MAASIFTPLLDTTKPVVSLHVSSSSYLPYLQSNRINVRPRPRRASKIKVSNRQSSITTASFSDPFVIEVAETLEDAISTESSSPPPFPLQKLRDASSESLLSTPWPSRKDEPFRFTDTSLIRNSQIVPVSSSPPQSLTDSEGTLVPNLVLIDGYIINSLSQLPELPDGAFIGSLSTIKSEDLMKRVSEFMSSFVGDLFSSINGVGAPDLVVVYVPEGCRIESPLHLRYHSIEGAEIGENRMPLSNPRVVVIVEKGGEVDLIEEYVGGDGCKCYWANSVLQVVIGEGAKLKHSYIQNQSLNAAHVKWTSVTQESASSYELVEISMGGKLSRHNLHIQQLGPDTSTDLSTFHLSTSDQTQDLHTSLVLDHPRGTSNQLHKCIVAHSLGQAVFDGNVKVNRYAQQTDAGQLTRSLLLEPRATVNIKPNLQIIADNVKCSHGAAISDLEDDQLFYFRARGVDPKTARRALIFSFANEVIERLPQSSLRKKVESDIKDLLDPTLENSS